MTIKQQGGIFGRNPTFNNVEVDGSISGDGQIDFSTGTGVTKGAILKEHSFLLFTDQETPGASDDIKGIELVSPTTTRVIFHSTNAGGRKYGLYTSTNGEFALYDYTAGATRWQTTSSGNLAFPLGQGIDFSATSGTGTSELFDDYEEGSFSADTSGLTLNYTFTSKFGRYTKVGDMVTAWFRYEWTSANTGSGDTSFGALPFAATENGYVHITECTGNIAADQIHGRVISGTSSFKIYGRNNVIATQVGPSQRTIWGSSNVLAGVAVYKA